jgi:carbon monoxide dehydrogenase subunit G
MDAGAVCDLLHDPEAVSMLFPGIRSLVVCHTSPACLSAVVASAGVQYLHPQVRAAVLHVQADVVGRQKFSVRDAVRHELTHE